MTIGAQFRASFLLENKEQDLVRGVSWCVTLIPHYSPFGLPSALRLGLEESSGSKTAPCSLVRFLFTPLTTFKFILI